MIGKLGVEYKVTGTKGKRFALGSERVQTQAGGVPNCDAYHPSYGSFSIKTKAVGF